MDAILPGDSGYEGQSRYEMVCECRGTLPSSRPRRHRRRRICTAARTSPLAQPRPAPPKPLPAPPSPAMSPRSQIKEVARGAFGLVVLSVDKLTGEQVALK